MILYWLNSNVYSSSLRINQNQKDLRLHENNGSNTELRQRITEATLDLNKRYYALMAKRMSIHNADILANFIISCRKERTIAVNTVMIYIVGISYLENFHKHKDLDKMDRNDIISFLDSYRKPEIIDPLHRWINTYNIRMTAVSKFFKWLYSPKFDGRTAISTTPPIISGIKRLTRKEKTSYQAKDLWTSEEDALFLKYCEDDRLKCYHSIDIYPCYTMGYRHQIIYGLSGLMHKHYVAIESCSSLIQKLSVNDEEKDNRLSILHSTYQKNPKEVSGYQYFLSVLENVGDGDRVYAKSILSKIINIIFAQINNHGIIMDLTERVTTEFTFKTMRDNEEIYYYDIITGSYRKFGDRIIKEYIEILHPSIKTFQVNEIIQKIKRRTPVERDQFDNNINIINVQNGLLNIWTGELIDHSSDFLSIVQLPLIYNPKTRCPNIGRFLAQVLHPEDVLTALEVIGYTLCRTTIYEKAVMLYGNGDNGKGVFIKLIEAFVGRENCSHVPLQERDNDKFSSADLFGKLVNTFADLKSQKLLATGYFKTLVSGDSVRAQEKYGKPFSFRNYAKLIFSTNKIPDSDDKSYAYFKRWLILSFEKVFQGNTKDTNLINKLTTSDELSGLLNLALISLRQLRKDGGFKEISVEKVRKEYEYNANTVKAFLEEKCVIDLTSPEYSTPTVYFYNVYEIYCKAKQTRPLEMNVFGSNLKEYGIEKERIRSHGDREYHYFGVNLDLI